MSIPNVQMENIPFITILTASLNRATSIRETIKSIRDQSFQNLEHIIIDGGSRDETPMILRKNENTYNLTWISEPDHGISDALNKGLQLARGRYILVLHADDQLLTPHILEIIYLKLKSERFDIYSFPVLLEHAVRGRMLFKPIRIIWWYHFKTIFPHQGCLVHRRIFDKIGGFRKEFSIALDYDFFYRILSKRPSIKFEKQPISVMGGMGISSDQNLLVTRLEEEVKVQNLHEKNPYWQLAQLFFHMLYFPYKTRFLPKFKTQQ